MDDSLILYSLQTPSRHSIEHFDMQFDLLLCFCKQQLQLAKVNRVIYLRKSQLLFEKKMQIILRVKSLLLMLYEYICIMHLFIFHNTERIYF